MYYNLKRIYVRSRNYAIKEFIDKRLLSITDIIFYKSLLFSRKAKNSNIYDLLERKKFKKRAIDEILNAIYILRQFRSLDSRIDKYMELKSKFGRIHRDIK